MSFSVDTVSLAGLPTLLDRLAEDARSGAAHLDTAPEDEEPGDLFRGLEHERQ